MKTVFKSAFKLALLAALLAGTTRADSLWPAAGTSSHASMFADRKAAAVGDIVTIVVAESAVASSSQSKKSTREAKLDDGLKSFFFTGPVTTKGVAPSMSLGGGSSYTGGGDVSNSQTLSARAAVLVTDVLPNGNLVIQGVRVVTFSGETQYVVLHGIIRSDDIARDNSVQSTNIADARVEFYAEGALTDAQKRGWLAKTYEKLRPF